MRGEHTRPGTAPGTKRGSSPHARGAQPRLKCVCSARGVIPACAGSTGARLVRTGRVRGHPRMRGEHYNRYPLPPTAEGSSPHARGARKTVSQMKTPNGVIPACAGSTKPFAFPFDTSRGHPRMRGEHGPFGPYSHLSLGSSPHARGALKE